MYHARHYLPLYPVSSLVGSGIPRLLAHLSKPREREEIYHGRCLVFFFFSGLNSGLSCSPEISRNRDVGDGYNYGVCSCDG